MNDLHNSGRYTWRNGYYEGGWKNSTRHGKVTCFCVCWESVFLCVAHISKTTGRDPMDERQLV
jgi:hypothetical protein